MHQRLHAVGVRKGASERHAERPLRPLPTKERQLGQGLDPLNARDAVLLHSLQTQGERRGFEVLL